MEVRITIEDSRLESILNNESTALTDEEIHEVLHKALVEYVHENQFNAIKNAVVSSSYSGYYLDRDLVKKIINDCDFSALQDCIDYIIDELKKNYTSVLAEILAQVLAEKLTKSNTFYEATRDTIPRYFVERNNPPA